MCSLVLSKLVEIARQEVEFQHQSALYRSVFGRWKTGFHYNKHSFCAEKDGGYKHVSFSNLFEVFTNIFLKEK